MAQEIVAKYKKRTKRTHDIASLIAGGLFWHISYGFSDLIRQGQSGIYLHEAVKESECFSHAGMTYLLAKEAGLDATINFAENMTDTKEGADPKSGVEASHAFITYKLGKDQFLIDPQMCVYGKIKKTKNPHELHIHGSKGQVTVRQFDRHKEVSEQEYLRQMEERRTPKGIKIALNVGQKLHVSNVPTFISAKDSYIKTHISLSAKLAAPTDYDGVKIIEMIYPIDGTFSVSEATCKAQFAENVSWTGAKNPLSGLEIPGSVLTTYWNLLAQANEKKGWAADSRHLRLFTVDRRAIELGFNTNTQITKGSILESIVTEKSMQKVIGMNEELLRESARKFKDESKSSQKSWSVFLVRALYEKLSRQAAPQGKMTGIIHPIEQLDNFLKDAYAEYCVLMDRFAENAKNMQGVIVGLRDGNKATNERLFEKRMTSTIENMDEYFQISNMKRIKDDQNYYDFMDRSIFRRENNPTTIDVAKIEEQLTEQDLVAFSLLAVQRSVIDSYYFKQQLTMPQYKTGIRKLMAKIKEANAQEQTA